MQINELDPADSHSAAFRDDAGDLVVNQSPPSQHSQEPFTKEEVRDVTRGAPAVPAAAAPLRLNATAACVDLPVLWKEIR